MPVRDATPDNQTVNASGYISRDSTVKLLERYSVIRRGSRCSAAALPWSFAPKQDVSRRHRVTEMHENEIGTLIVDSAAHSHQGFGPGPLEIVYGVTLAGKLRTRGLSVQRQVFRTFH